MKMNDLINSVSAAWNFFAPPAFQLFGLLLIAWIILGKAYFSMFVPLTAITPSDELRKAAEFYGITKIMPLIAVFCLLLFLHAFRAVLSALMNTLPPILSTKNWPLMQTVQPRIVAFVWACIPEAEEPGDLQTLVRDVIHRGEAERSAIVDEYLEHQRKRFALTHVLFNFLKVACYWTLFITIWAVRRNIPGAGDRSMTLLPVMVLMWTASLIVLVQLREQLVSAEFLVAQLFLKQTPPGKLPSEEEVARRQTRILAEYTGERWWGLDFFIVRFIRTWKARRRQYRTRVESRKRS
jgi:hypothetical protein